MVLIKKNCHFSIFSSKEKTKEWEKGKKDIEKKIKGENNGKKRHILYNERNGNSCYRV